MCWKLVEEIVRAHIKLEKICKLSQKKSHFAGLISPTFPSRVRMIVSSVKPSIHLAADRSLDEGLRFLWLALIFASNIYIGYMPSNEIDNV